ncbi:MAG: HDOD domain-containing protein [Planctomycetota bacterium]|jgi:HD-like signal output (HDOD) protein
MITSTAELEDLVDGTVRIPTLPTVLREIQTITAASEGSAKDAAHIIETDPAIATRVLRLVNSSFYSLKNPVSSIGLACSILGLTVIKNVVEQASVLQAFGGLQTPPGFDASWLWDHSFKTAVACRMLAQRTTIAVGLARDEAYTCGLVHDVGKLILMDSRPSDFAEALALSQRAKLPLAIAEGEVFGFNHAHVGGLLAQRWKLAATVQAGVTFHHSPATTPEDWARGFLVKAANTIAHLAASVPGGYLGDLACAESMQTLGLTPTQMAEVTAATASVGLTP